MKFSKSLLGAALAAAMAFTAPSAQADYSATFQNVTFTIAPVDTTTFDFTISNALNANGDWTGISTLLGFDFKDIGASFTGATAQLIVPAGSTYTGGIQQLNANGCGNGAPAGSICFDIIPPISLANTMTFEIVVAGGTLSYASIGPHLQIAFGDGTYDSNCLTNGVLDPTKLGVGGCSTTGYAKVGTLYSQNIGASSSSTSSSGLASSSGTVPEPNAGYLALFGVGLLAASFVRRGHSQRG